MRDKPLTLSAPNPPTHLRDEPRRHLTSLHSAASTVTSNGTDSDNATRRQLAHADALSGDIDGIRNIAGESVGEEAALLGALISCAREHHSCH